MSILNLARAKTQLILLGKGRRAENVSIPKIPQKMENFLDTDYQWVEVHFPESENSSNCIYVGRKKSIFPPHFHKYSDEMLTVLNKEGVVKCVSETDVKTIKYGETFVFEAGVTHAVVFEAESKVFIHWHPHFEGGWDAEFIEDQSH